MPEIRVLKEGQYQNQQEQKRKQRAQQKTGSSDVSSTRMDIEKSHDESDKKLVQQMDTN